MRLRRPARIAVGCTTLAGTLAASLLTAPAQAGPARTAADLPPAPAPTVLAPIDPTASTATPPTSAGIRAQIGPIVRADLDDASVLVVDPGSGTVLFDRTPNRPRLPASTTKLTTAAAALTVLDPNERLTTAVYRDGDRLYLVGGGDPTLVRRGGGNPLAGGAASLADLARQVAAAVDGPVRLVYDTSAFRGPRLGPGWPTSFPAAGVAAPVSALVVDSGRVRPGATARVADPGRQAAEAFAGLLRADGVVVTGVAQGTSPPALDPIGSVQSPPIADIVQRMLTESDNDYAEALAHLVGGRLLDRPTFAGGARATREALARLGLDVTGVDLADGSGLSRRNRIPARLLADLLIQVARGTTPALGTIAAGLPVAGLTGTLADRFASASTRPGRGFVHAKTGTLTGVVGLAGTVQDADGRVLVFAVIDDHVPSIPATREAVDVLASRLATCGCSS